MTDSISPVIDRLAELIQGIEGAGRVLKFNPRDRKDIAQWVVSDIEGVKVTRAWWIQGPYMTSGWLTRMSPQHIDRVWTYEIHGIDGFSPSFDGDTRDPGEDLQTIRTLGLAICDAIDADLDLGGTVFDAEPCQWRSPGPQHRMFGPSGSAFGAAHLVIEKRVRHMPDRT